MNKVVFDEPDSLDEVKAQTEAEYLEAEYLKLEYIRDDSDSESDESPLTTDCFGLIENAKCENEDSLIQEPDIMFTRFANPLV